MGCVGTLPRVLLVLKACATLMCKGNDNSVTAHTVGAPVSHVTRMPPLGRKPILSELVQNVLLTSGGWLLGWAAVLAMAALSEIKHDSSIYGCSYFFSNFWCPR